MSALRVLVRAMAVVLLFVLLMAGSSVQSVNGQTAGDSATVVQDFVTSLNDHDVNRAMGLLAPGAMVQADGTPQTDGQILAWLEELVREDIRVHVVGWPRFSWDPYPPRTRTIVNWPLNLAMNRYREAGFAWVDGTIGAIVMDGKITFVRIWPNPGWRDRPARAD